MEVGKWHISKETKQINNYTCYKATKTESIDNSNIDNKRNVVAWFCPNLPSFFGPASYFGLPGTILEVSNGQITLKATKIKLEKESKEKIEILHERELLTQKEYEAIIRKIAKERFDIDFKN